MVAKMVEGMRKIQLLVQKQNKPIRKQAVAEMGSICQGLVGISSQRLRE